MNTKNIKYYKSQEYEVEFVVSKDLERKYPMHNHVSIYTIGIILKGRIRLIKKNEQHILEESDLYIIPPYEPHSIETFDGSYSIISICIGKKLFQDSTENIVDIIEKVEKQLFSGGQIEQRYLSAILDSVAIIKDGYLFRDNIFDEMINQTKSEIETNPERQLNLDQLAQSIFISKYYFVRQFKENIGLSPHNFQIQNRIRKAQHLLVDGKSVVEVAADMGFYDQSHFNKYFKKIVGMSPTEYQNSYYIE